MQVSCDETLNWELEEAPYAAKGRQWWFLNWIHGCGQAESPAVTLFFIQNVTAWFLSWQCTNASMHPQTCITNTQIYLHAFNLFQRYWANWNNNLGITIHPKTRVTRQLELQLFGGRTIFLIISIKNVKHEELLNNALWYSLLIITLLFRCN